MSKVSFRILGKVILAVLVFLSFSILLQNCSSYQEYHFRKNYSDANKLQHNTNNLSEKLRSALAECKQFIWLLQASSVLQIGRP